MLFSVKNTEVFVAKAFANGLRFAPLMFFYFLSIFAGIRVNGNIAHMLTGS